MWRNRIRVVKERLPHVYSISEKVIRFSFKIQAIDEMRCLFEGCLYYMGTLSCGIYMRGHVVYEMVVKLFL